MGKHIKVKLMQLDKKQVDLLDELHVRGYPRIDASQLSRYVNGRDPSPQCEAVMAIVEQIIAEWEANTDGRIAWN